MISPHAITSLTLENFRNYRSLSLSLPPQPVVLRGRNGAGKTNILEAISLLSPGRGLRGAKLREMDCLVAASAVPLPLREREGPTQWGGEGALQQSAQLYHPLTQPSPARGEGLYSSAPWVVAARIATGDETTHIGTARDGESTAEKRIIKINGEKVRGHAQLAAHVCVQWLTPSMDQVFIEGGTVRRKLLDRLVYGFVPEHAARVMAYESAMRERNKLLADRATADPYWLSVLEQQMAEHAVAITLARQEVLGRLQHELVEDIAGFPRAVMAVEGLMEGWLSAGDSALDVEGKFAEHLTQARGIDAARRRASIGPQRSSFIVVHKTKNMPAEQCSTGEQKALLLSIMLCAARARAAWCGVAPILLLDEVIAHLDVDKRASLFDLIRHSQIQAWMTGTDAADFKGLEAFSTTLEIDGGTVRM
jgi:DNA replication and repair protein RecF